MADLRCEENPAKAASNFTKHGVSFDEASTAFLDASAATWFDDDHFTPDDQRYIHLGYSTGGRLLFIVHNEDDGLIRLISARHAIPAEREIYEEA